MQDKHRELENQISITYEALLIIISVSSARDLPLDSLEHKDTVGTLKDHFNESLMRTNWTGITRQCNGQMRMTYIFIHNHLN